MDCFWTQLLPALEEYWLHGEDVPKGYVKQFPFERSEVSCDGGLAGGRGADHYPYPFLFLKA
jgi:hypothetical protein